MIKRLNQDNAESVMGANELIKDLSQNTSDAVKSMRQSNRLDVRVKVYVEQASLSVRNGIRLQGVTGDVSSGGSQILLAKPLGIGDVYQLSFDRNELDLAPVYALCLRGRQVRPDAFEAGLRFLEPVTLPQVDETTTEGLL